MKSVNPFRVMLSTAWKELQIIFKDRGFLAIVIGLPLVMSMLNGSLNERLGAGEEIALPIAIVNMDEGAYSQQIVDTLGGISALKLNPLTTYEEAEDQVLDSKMLAAVIIPEGLTQNLIDYKPSEVLVIVDPTQQAIAANITGILREIAAPLSVQGEVSYAIRTLLADAPAYQNLDEASQRAIEAQSMAAQMSQVSKMMADPWIQVETKDLTGEDVVLLPTNMFGLFVPSFTVMFAFFIVGSMGASLLREKREGSLRRLIAAPIPRWAIIAGKMLGYVGLVYVQVIIIFGVANLVFDMPLGKSGLGLLILTLALGLASTGLGIMLAALSKSEKQADSLGVILGFALAGIGGCFIIGSPVPLYKMGGTIEIISKLVPHSHALMGFDALINQSATWVDVLPQTGLLLAYAVVFLMIAVWRFKFE